MDFNEYQKFTESLAVYNQQVIMDPASPDWMAEVDKRQVEGNLEPVDVPPIVHMPYIYPVMAVAEEAGEVNGKVAKFIRKSRTMSTKEVEEAVAVLRVDVKKELGDVLFQVSEAARMFGWTLQEVVDGNVEKLSDRKERGVLIGEGDNR